MAICLFCEWRDTADNYEYDTFGHVVESLVGVSYGCPCKHITYDERDPAGFGAIVQNALEEHADAEILILRSHGLEHGILQHSGDGQVLSYEDLAEAIRRGLSADVAACAEGAGPREDMTVVLGGCHAMANHVRIGEAFPPQIYEIYGFTGAVGNHYVNALAASVLAQHVNLYAGLRSALCNNLSSLVPDSDACAIWRHIVGQVGQILDSTPSVPEEKQRFDTGGAGELVLLRRERVRRSVQAFPDECEDS